MVLFPHGAPRTRHVNGFDYWTPFFVGRGWAVLQVNFRGSSGCGSDFEAAGFERWGLEMQDDLTDGVEWLAKQGSIDPDKVCIVVASDGGHAAMLGAIKTLKLYRCAISIADLRDLRDLLAQERYFIGYEIAAEREIGYLWSGREVIPSSLQGARIAFRPRADTGSYGVGLSNDATDAGKRSACWMQRSYTSRGFSAPSACRAVEPSQK